MISGFQNPPVENRPRPFWFFNGDMDRAEVKRQVEEMKAKGLGGFFLCARQGLQVPYLSEEWFELCRYTVGLAKENGLEVWLYDEYPYPSGMSGGEVTIRHPEAKQTDLDVTDELLEGDVSLSLGRVKVLSATAYPVTDGAVDWSAGVNLAGQVGILQNQQIYQRTMLPNSVHNTKRYFTYGPSKELRWKAPAGKWRVLVFCEKEIEDFKYYGDFLDPANPIAVQSFIETTYEPYKRALGEDFGGVVKGMFGDETGYLGHCPWSAMLPGYYREKYGRELADDLPALHDAAFPDAAMIRYRYIQCLHEMLRDNYHKPLAEWCEKNHIAYVTEIPSLRMSNQRYSHVPGSDPNHDKLGFPLEKALDRDLAGLRSNSKVVSAIARQFDRRDCLDEAFHSIGWSMTLQDAKWQIDRQTLMGITLHNFHAYYYTVDGITKHDAPPSQFVQNPYWSHYSALADYCARSSRFVTETEYSCRTALFHPVTSWWTSSINTLHRVAYYGKDEGEQRRVQRMINDYTELCKSFLFSGVDYDDLDAEVLALARVEGGVISIGRARYDTVVVPPVKNMEGYALRLLERFAAQGGKLIFCGLTPFESIEEGFDVPAAFRKLWGGLDAPGYFGEAGKASLSEQVNVSLIRAPGGLAASGGCALAAEAAKKYSPPRTSVTVPAEALGKVVYSRRESAEADFVLLSSQDGVSALCTVESAEPGRVFVEFDLETGEAFRLGASGKLEVPLSPWQSRLVAAMEPKAASAYAEKPQNAPAEKIVLPLGGKLPVRVAGENALRMEALELSIDGGAFLPAKPHMFVEQYRQAGQLQAHHLDFSSGFGLPLRPHMQYPIPAVYRLKFYVETLPEHISLVRDRMGIMGGHTVRVNGSEVTFAPKRYYDQNNLAADIASLVKPGENVVEIAVTVTEDWHGVSDPLYLFGDFGVFAKDGKFVIGKTPAEAAFDARFAEGFPFYSGEYTFTARMELPKTDVLLTLPEGHIHEILSVSVDGQDLGIRAFAPYCWELAANSARPAVSEIQVTMTNTLINLLEGSYFDYAQAKTIAIEP